MSSKLKTAAAALAVVTTVAATPAAEAAPVTVTYDFDGPTPNLIFDDAYKGAVTSHPSVALGGHGGSGAFGIIDGVKSTTIGFVNPVNAFSFHVASDRVQIVQFHALDQDGTPLFSSIAGPDTPYSNFDSTKLGTASLTGEDVFYGVKIDRVDGPNFSNMGIDTFKFTYNKAADPTPVPEPATPALLATALAAAALMRRREKGAEEATQPTSNNGPAPRM